MIHQTILFNFVNRSDYETDKGDYKISEK